MYIILIKGGGVAYEIYYVQGVPFALSAVMTYLREKSKEYRSPSTFMEM